MAWTNNSTDTALSAVPANGGTGFQAWTSSEVGGAAAGYFLGSSTEFGGGNLNSVDGSSFGMYGQGSGNNAYAYRKLINGLMVGGIWTCKIGINYRNGYKGVQFYKAGTPTFLFQAAADQYQYTTNFSTYTNTGWVYGAQSVFTVRAERTTSSNTAYTVSRDGAPGDTFTVNVATNTDIDEVGFFVGNTTAAQNESNLYFNSLSAYNAYR